MPANFLGKRARAGRYHLYDRGTRYTASVVPREFERIKPDQLDNIGRLPHSVCKIELVVCLP